jgi:hypothetical protein
MNEEYENGKSYLPETRLLRHSVVFFRRQPLSRIALRGVVQLADQQFGRVEARSMNLPPRWCAQFQFPRDGMAHVDVVGNAFVESARSPTGLPRRWCAQFQIPTDGIADVDMAGISLVESAQSWSDRSWPDDR